MPDRAGNATTESHSCDTSTSGGAQYTRGGAPRFPGSLAYGYPSQKPSGVRAPDGFINGRGLQTTRSSLMDNVNHLLAFRRFLNDLKNIGWFLKAATAITHLLPSDFSIRLAVRCRWGQKP
jgi:hypothetical protein